MKRLLTFSTALTLVVLCRAAIAVSLPDGFHLPDSIKEMTLRYRSVQNLIVLPVKINDSITVNLILDTGCRNLVLFGKKFKKLMKLEDGRPVQFSGLGSGKPVVGALSLYNRISIHQVLGERIPVVVVPSKNVLSHYKDVDGVIGFELFLKFEIELNPRAKTITFRPAEYSSVPEDFSSVPLRIVDLRPVMDSKVSMGADVALACDLMIDTGSNLGLLVKTTEMEKYTTGARKQVIGFGFNGEVMGYQTLSEKLSLDGLSLEDVPTGVIESPWHNYASIGMNVLKDYILIINYYKLYACFKKLTAVS
ncbi:MAG TPA: retropepsin-like aspartic protease [Chryseosolibacter sp.]